jgi:hypothetical protein
MKYADAWKIANLPRDREPIVVRTPMLTIIPGFAEINAETNGVQLDPDRVKVNGVCKQLQNELDEIKMRVSSPVHNVESTVELPKSSNVVAHVDTANAGSSFTRLSISLFDRSMLVHKEKNICAGLSIDFLTTPCLVKAVNGDLVVGRINSIVTVGDDASGVLIKHGDVHYDRSEWRLKLFAAMFYIWAHNIVKAKV